MTQDKIAALLQGISDQRTQIAARLDGIDPPLADAVAAIRTGLVGKVQSAVSRGGTLDVALGATSVAWTPGTPLTLRGYAAMTQSQVKALTLAQTQELLAKLAPLLMDVAVTTKRAGKLAVRAYDDPT